MTKNPLHVATLAAAILMTTPLKAEHFPPPVLTYGKVFHIAGGIYCDTLEDMQAVITAGQIHFAQGLVQFALRNNTPNHRGFPICAVTSPGFSMEVLMGETIGDIYEDVWLHENMAHDVYITAVQYVSATTQEVMEAVTITYQKLEKGQGI